ncbi:hypothetical protein WOLCODRAFT_56529, partial [Wolfiporia cocos MD-104 SS10]
ILNDWGLCKYKNDMDKVSQSETRSDTWQFMSAALLWSPEMVHKLSDDMESFVHMLDWPTFRYHKTQLSNDSTALQKRVYHLYNDQYKRRSHNNHGGENKMRTGKAPCRAKNNPLYLCFLDSLAELCKEHY